jgi:hypothetical protein
VVLSGVSEYVVRVESRKKKTKEPSPATTKKKVQPRAKTPAAVRYGRRADLGAPIETFLAKQPASLRPILEELRKLVEQAAPDANSSLKWGMPFYTIGGTMMCALGGHKSHVNLILSGPPNTYLDPKGLLSGEGKTGRHLKVMTLGDLPRSAVQGWLRTAAKLAREKR